MRELAEHDQEDDQTGDPRVEFVKMYNFITEDGDDPCRRRDDDDARITRHVGVDGVDQLGADYDVHGGPAHTGEDIEACNCDAALVPVLRRREKGHGCEENASFVGEAHSHLLTLTP